MLELLRDRGLTLATAESCTGGLVGARLTDVAGASDVFVGGAIVYSNAAKESQLGVPARAPRRARRRLGRGCGGDVAQGARERLGADVAVAVTGIAGPGGGTEEKPVGLVFVHASGPMGERDLRLDFPGDRETIRGPGDGRRAARRAAFVDAVVTDTSHASL